MLPEIVAGNALGLDVMVMAGILAAIAILALLFSYRRRSATWGRLLKLAVILFAVGGFAFWQYCRDQEAAFREGRARDVIELISVEKTIDAINMFEDLVRIQFRFRNMSQRAVESFGIQFMLRDSMGRMVIEDHISVTNKIPPRQTSSWSVKYWATCPQEFTPDEWEELVKMDIRDFDVEWFADGLAFEDGEVIR